MKWWNNIADWWNAGSISPLDCYLTLLVVTERFVVSEDGVEPSVETLKYISFFFLFTLKTYRCRWPLRRLSQEYNKTFIWILTNVDWVWNFFAMICSTTRVFPALFYQIIQTLYTHNYGRSSRKLLETQNFLQECGMYCLSSIKFKKNLDLGSASA